MKRRSFLGLLASALVVPSEWLVETLLPCPLCDAGLPHFPPLKRCKWRETNLAFRNLIPKSWIGEVEREIFYNEKITIFNLTPEKQFPIRDSESESTKSSD